MLAPVDAAPVGVERAGRPQWRQAVGDQPKKVVISPNSISPESSETHFRLTTREEQSSWGALGSHSTSSCSFADVQFDDSFRQTAFGGVHADL